MNISDVKRQVDAKLQEGIAKAEKRFGRTFPFPKVTYDLTGKTAGKAFWPENRIKLNLSLLIKNFDDAINSTVLHELAHLVCFRVHPRAQGHGDEFKSICWLLGIKSDTCHNYDTSTTSRLVHYAYKCHCQIHQISSIVHNKMAAGQERSCRKCKGKLVRVSAGTQVKPGVKTFTLVREL